jgi:hypothetical protein
VLEETLASPRLQRALNRIAGAIGLRSPRDHLRDADEMLARAVRARRDFAEARIHLGRTRGLLGRASEAVTELHAGIDAADDPRLKYYGFLFLGREQERQKRPDAARDAYTRAAALFPDAQSPRLALARLHEGGPDDRAAVAALQRVLTLSSAASDPWWTYASSAGRQADARLEQLRATFAAGDHR